VFFLLVVGGLIFSCAIKEKTDISIAYNGPRELSSSQLETLNNAFSEVVPDYDKDGKTDIKWTNNLYRSFDQQVEYNGGVVPSVQQQTANNEALEQINYLVISGQFNFMLLDKAVFEKGIKDLDKSKTYYLYCRSGRRSNSAALMMKKEGFKVFDLKGGILAWEKTGFPILR
jgi:rhodanese-related sulfurtransferase